MLPLLIACQASDQVSLADIVDDAPADDPSAPLFARDRVIEVAITMDPEDWDELRNQERDLVEMLTGDCLAQPFSDPYTWFHGDVTIDGEAVADVGVRKRGLLGSASTVKPGLKLKFDKYTDGGTFSGLERMSFTNAQQDPTLMHMCLTYDAFAAAGLAAPRCSFAHVTMNGEDLGAYVHIEAMDETALARHFADPTGDLWEGTLSDFRDGWVGTFDPKDEDNDPATLQAVADALEADDDALIAQVEGVVDLDQFVRFWAMEMLTGHWDGYAGNTNNFFVYADPSDGRLRFMPWGADATWDSATPFAAVGIESAAVVANAQLPMRLAGTSEGRARFEAALREVTEGWDEAATLAEIDRLEALLAPYMGRDHAASVEAVREVVRGRRDTVLSELDAGLAYDGWQRGNPCLVPYGELTATFSTTWGTYEAGDYTSGDAEITFTWDGADYPTTGQGVAAGYLHDRAFLILIGDIGYGANIAPYVAFDPDLVAPGAVAMPGSSSILLYKDRSTGDEWVQAAYMGDGTINFQQAGTGDGDAVVGTMSAVLYGGEG